MKIIEQWLFFEVIEGEFTLLSKRFETKRLAEIARLKYPESQRKKIGVGVIRIGSPLPFTSGIKAFEGAVFALRGNRPV
jgi:hypothetical protein